MTFPEQARQDLAEILSGGRVEIGEAQARMAELGHPAGRIDRARRALDIVTVRKGGPITPQTVFWELPGTCPTCRRPFWLGVTPAPAPPSAPQADAGDEWSEDPVPTEPSPIDLTTPPSGPPRCTVCGRTSAFGIGERCPWQPGGFRCQGVMA